MARLINCHMCGQPFIAHTPNSKYCPTCSKEARRISNAESAKRKREERAALRNDTQIKKAAQQKPQQKPKPATARPTIKTVDDYCIGCAYLMRVGDGTNACDYIGATEKRRPCPAGTGCTVRKEG